MNTSIGSSSERADPTDSALAGVVVVAWRDVLAVDVIGLDDDFFDLGGNSLAAVRIIGRLEEDLDLELSVRAVLELRTLRGMIGHVQELAQMQG